MKTEHLGITKEEFDAYLKVQRRGKFNMVMEAHLAMRSARLLPWTYWFIIENYETLYSAFYGKEGK